MTLLTIAASLFLLQNTTGSIEGTVLNTVTNKPIVGAQVSATRLATPPVGLIPGVGAARSGIVVGALAGIVGGAGAPVTGPVSDEITIVLAKNGGQITGIVRGDAQQPVSNSQVTLILNQRDRRDLYEVATMDSGGRFTFRAVSPGSYKVFAWREIERNSWLDPAFLRAYETSGAAASVGNSSDVTLNLKVIPDAAR